VTVITHNNFPVQGNTTKYVYSITQIGCGLSVHKMKPSSLPSFYSNSMETSIHSYHYIRSTHQHKSTVYNLLWHHMQHYSHLLCPELLLQQNRL